MPKLGEKGVVHILGLLILIVGLGVGLYLVGTKTNLLPKASLGTNVYFVDSSGNTITQTNSATVNVKFNDPQWSSNKISLVKEANAQGVFDRFRRESRYAPAPPPNKSRCPQGTIMNNNGLCVPQATSSPAPPASTAPVTTVKVKLAEDPNFTSNYIEASFSAQAVTYTFTNSNPGTKTLYAKFVASDGREQNANPYPVTISLIAPSPSPSPVAGYVFVTSTSYQGDLGGLTGADQKCQDRADAASLGGTWKAWLSDSNTSAASRLTHSSVPYKLINGTVIANGWTDLTDGTIQSPIDVTEQGVKVVGTPVWTGTRGNGSAHSESNNFCRDWTIAGYYAQGDRAYRGISWVTTEAWTNASFDGCYNYQPIYCFEQTGTITVPNISPSPTPAYSSPYSYPTPTYTTP